MDTHLVVWTVGIGSVAVVIIWLCLVAGAEGARLSADLDRAVLGGSAAREIAEVPRPGRAPRLRTVVDPEYGQMILAEDEAQAWFPSSATA